MRAYQLVAWQSPPELRDAEGRLCVELFSGHLPRRVSAIGKGFGCRPGASGIPGKRAGVGKPAKNEPAGKR